MMYCTLLQVQYNCAQWATFTLKTKPLHCIIRHKKLAGKRVVMHNDPSFWLNQYKLIKFQRGVTFRTNRPRKQTCVSCITLHNLFSPLVVAAVYLWNKFVLSADIMFIYKCTLPGDFRKLLLFPFLRGKNFMNFVDRNNPIAWWNYLLSID